MDRKDSVELALCEERIAFILGHPGFSGWVKEVIRSALMRNPLAVLNDIEVLNHVLKRKCEIEAAAACNSVANLH